MELKPGLSALVTSGASGIGKALLIALAEKGIFVTAIDFSEERGKEVALLVEKANCKFHSNLGFPTAVFVKCNVSNTSECPGRVLPRRHRRPPQLRPRRPSPRRRADPPGRHRQLQEPPPRLLGLLAYPPRCFAGARREANFQ
ncbi:hypothetical protein NL676_036994 [Syzygium grande]|nr:hypothetical protein NL676_036994 [Syzygium grande]